MFCRGQKVVCVDDDFPQGITEFYTALPTKGTEYVVRDVLLGVSLAGKSRGEIAILLEGVNNPASTTPPHPERGFKCERFAPIETTEETEERHEPAYAFS